MINKYSFLSISEAFVNKNANCFNVVMRKSIFSFRSRLFESDNTSQSKCIFQFFHLTKSVVNGMNYCTVIIFFSLCTIHVALFLQ